MKQLLIIIAMLLIYPASANARGAGDGYFSDLPDTPCPDIGNVDGLKLNPAQMNVVFNDGSMLYGTVIESGSLVTPETGSVYGEIILP